MKIHWTPAAEGDHEHHDKYLADASPQAALDQISRLLTRVAQLADYPEQGRPGRLRGTRELIVTGTPFVVVYVVGERVEIIRVLHGAQKWP